MHPKFASELKLCEQVELSLHELDELIDMVNSTDDERGICYDDIRNFYDQYRQR